MACPLTGRSLLEEGAAECCTLRSGQSTESLPSAPPTPDPPDKRLPLLAGGEKCTELDLLYCSWLEQALSARRCTYSLSTCLAQPPVYVLIFAFSVLAAVGFLVLPVFLGRLLELCGRASLSEELSTLTAALTFLTSSAVGKTEVKGRVRQDFPLGISWGSLLVFQVVVPLGRTCSSL